MAKPKRPTLKELSKLATAWLTRVVTQPRDELSRWERRARFGYDLSKYGARKLRQDRAPQMAAALAFRTLFGLLPVLVVGTIVVRAVGGFDSVRDKIGGWLSSMGLDGYRVQSEAGASSSLRDWLVGLLGEVENLDLTAVTWVGIGVLIYSAVSLMVEIENCLNRIYHAPRGRPWVRRLPIYWTLLTLGPVALGMAVFLGNHIDEVFAGVARGVALFGLLFAGFKWLPNTNVTFRSAMAGALASSILLTIATVTMGAYLSNALAIRQLYGSLGLLPLFMLWVYIMWLMVLFGVEVAAAVQRFAGRELEVADEFSEPVRLVDPAMVLGIVQVLAERFAGGETIGPQELSQDTGIEERTIGLLLPRLREEGVLHFLDGEEERVVLAAPPESFDGARLLEIGFELTHRGQTPPPIVERLRDAQRALASGQTVAELVAKP
ncbi:MAG: YihY/virulence factor BrkB family protein [Myxococcota bacterium]